MLMYHNLSGVSGGPTYSLRCCKKFMSRLVSHFHLHRSEAALILQGVASNWAKKIQKKYLVVEDTAFIEIRWWRLFLASSLPKEHRSNQALITIPTAPPNPQKPALRCDSCTCPTLQLPGSCAPPLCASPAGTASAVTRRVSCHQIDAAGWT